MLARGGELRMEQRISEILLNDDKTVRLTPTTTAVRAIPTLVANVEPPFGPRLKIIPI